MSWLGGLRARTQDMLGRRGQVVGINRRNVLLVYAHNPREHYPQADDKLLTKELLVAAGVPVPRTLAVCDGLYTVAPVVQGLSGRGDFVVKPASSSGGQGILVVRDSLGPGRWQMAGGRAIDADALTLHLAQIVFGAFSDSLGDRGFVEERIVSHAVLAALSSHGLCDLRIITLRSEPVFAMIRVPTAQSGGRANLHQGGLGLALDLATGRTHRALHRGRSITVHPESGVPLLDVAVPDWAAVLDVARRAAGAVQLGYLGVDIVLDAQRGPMVIEINARPGLEIQNVHGQGMWPQVQPWL